MCVCVCLYVYIYIHTFFRKNKNIVPNIAHRSEFEKFFKKKDSFNWFTESDSFSVMVKILSMPEYKYSVLVGLLVCIGGVSESLVKILIIFKIFNFFIIYHRTILGERGLSFFLRTHEIDYRS